MQVAGEKCKVPAGSPRYAVRRNAACLPGRAVLASRTAMTLIELLVVISIMAVLLGVAIPVLSPANDTRRLREAARVVNTFISGAKVRAKETGRPFGVALKRLSADTGRAEDRGLCVEMHYVEQPPAYAGFDDNARVMLAYRSVDEAIVPGAIDVRFVRFGNADSSDDLPAGVDYDTLPGIFRQGDRIQIGNLLLQIDDSSSTVDGQGFYVDADSTLGTWVVSGNHGLSQLELGQANASTTDPSDASQLLNPVYNDLGGKLIDGADRDELPYWTEPLRYKILRQPTKTSANPEQLANRSAIDLEASGFGNGVRLHNQWNGSALSSLDDDVIVMFSPEGSISSVYSGGVRSLVSSNLFLLVGLRENQPAEDLFGSFSGSEAEKEREKLKINWLNGDTRWVVVGAQTGSIASAENAFVDPEEATAVVTAQTDDHHTLSNRRDYEISQAREFARQVIGMGGR